MHYSFCAMNVYSLFDCTLLLVALIVLIDSFNLDTDTPIFKIGPSNSFFGYSVAQHFIKDEPWLLIGAPKGESGQPNTHRAGAVYSCALNYISRSSSARSRLYEQSWCELSRVEYDIANLDKFDQAPDRHLYFNNKTDQWLGSVISSAGTSDSNVLVCAPNLIFGEYAHMDGACYLLQNNLTQIKEIHTCHSFPKSSRHNGYGQCQEGFSALLNNDYDMLITGLPGPKRWIGGVNAQEFKKFAGVGRFTMIDDHTDSVEKVLSSHIYLGYSVGVGLFGFPHESDRRGRDMTNYTVVAGSPRYNDTGAVFFMPFSKARSSAHDYDKLRLFDDRFKVTGAGAFASTFGYSIATLDIDKNGFDDLIVGAPNYYDASQSKPAGGAAFIYFASGKRTTNEEVFEDALVLIGPMSFGLSVSGLGDLNSDGFNDIVVGAPFDKNGGAIYIYLGAQHNDFEKKPSQIIYGQELRYNPVGNTFSTFGWSLSGGVDLDGNGYPDLLVGAFNSNAAVHLRAKPIIRAHALIDAKSLNPIDKDKPRNCRLPYAKTCFALKTMVRLDGSIGPSGRAFRCKLEVLADGSGAKRALFYDGKHAKNFSCPVNDKKALTEHDHELFILESNRDWLNPLKLRLSVSLPLKDPPMPSDTRPLDGVDDYPVLDKKYSTKEFTVEFDNKCGQDRECRVDLKLTCSFPGLPLFGESNKFLKDAGRDDNIDMNFILLNSGERAYETLLYVQYDEIWLERPQMLHGFIKEGKQQGGLVEYYVGNPMLENATANFTVRFSIIKDRSGRRMPRDPLKFEAFVNTTSKDLNPISNNSTVYVKVVTKTELSLNGYSTPRNKQLLFGGKVVGESALEYFEDVGPEVQHIYELKNEGPWPVNDIWVYVEFPYEVNSTYPRGKWALYVTDEPTILIANPVQSGLVTAKPCELDFRRLIVNPLQLKAEIVRQKREASEELNVLLDSSSMVLGRQTRQLRIKPQETTTIGGERIKQVTIDCNSDPKLRTAKCAFIKCPVKFLANNGNATITVISRLWNSTFVEDYRDVQLVEIISRARIYVPPDNVIEESDYENNVAEAITEANPDSPAISEKAPVPLWVIILAVLGGILLLMCIILLLWKCGFFNRKRHRDELLYRAEVKHNEDFDDSAALR